MSALGSQCVSQNREGILPCSATNHRHELSAKRASFSSGAMPTALRLEKNPIFLVQADKNIN